MYFQNTFTLYTLKGYFQNFSDSDGDDVGNSGHKKLDKNHSKLPNGLSALKEEEEDQALALKIFIKSELIVN